MYAKASFVIVTEQLGLDPLLTVNLVLSENLVMTRQAAAASSL